MKVNLFSQVTKQEEMASIWARGGLDWLLGKLSSLEGWSGIGTICPGKLWNPWKY